MKDKAGTITQFFKATRASLSRIWSNDCMYTIGGVYDIYVYTNTKPYSWDKRAEPSPIDGS